MNRDDRMVQTAFLVQLKRLKIHHLNITSPQTLVSSEKKTQWRQWALHYAIMQNSTITRPFHKCFSGLDLHLSQNSVTNHHPCPLQNNLGRWQSKQELSRRIGLFLVFSLLNSLCYSNYTRYCWLFWGPINETTETTESGPRKAGDSGVASRKQN